MADSLNLITAQISFLEPHLTLIHIPIELYSFCLQPILRLLFGEDHDQDAARIPWPNRHDFLNVSITPIECSIICSRHLADRFVAPFADILNRWQAPTPAQDHAGPRTAIEISHEDYIVIQVDGQGLDAGQRVLELTSPLAMAGISIFFITTYFSDYILVPFKAQRTVTQALQQRGFVFSQTAAAFVSQLSPASPTLSHNGRFFPAAPLYESAAPITPPAKDIPELQLRTFKKLKQHRIRPLVDNKIRLAICAGSREHDPGNDDRLKHDLTQVLIATAPPRAATQPGLGIDDARPTSASAPRDHGAIFFSLTITANEPVSVLVEHRLLDRLGDALLGAKSEDDALIPITLDLRDLPLDATGIVCGVAGRLAHGAADDHAPALDTSPGLASSASAGSDDPIDISFLSTARAGTVIVRASQLEKALEALDHGMDTAAEPAEPADPPSDDRGT